MEQLLTVAIILAIGMVVFLVVFAFVMLGGFAWFIKVWDNIAKGKW
jgi:hypothetical protein